MGRGRGGYPRSDKTPKRQKEKPKEIMQIQKQEYSHCNHIKVNGTRCGSPALREKPFCYFHNRIRKLHASPLIPFLEDANAIQFGLSEILQAMQEDRIDPKKAAA